MIRTLQKPIFQDLFNMGLLGITMLPLLALALHNHPSPVDDYCYIDTVFKYGYFEAMNFYYTGWTGRYFGILLNHSNPLIFRWPGGFKLLSFLLLLGLIWSVYGLLKALLPRWSRTSVWGMTGVVLFLYLLKMMSVVEAFYWMAAFVTYTVPNILTLCWLTVMIKWYQLPNGLTKKLTSVLASFLVFATIGSSETNLTLMVLLVAGWFGYQLVINRKWDWFAFSLVAVAAFSCYLFFSSPGNAQRIGGNPESGKIWFSSLASLRHLATLTFEWLSRTPLLMFSILWIAVLPKIFDHTPETTQLFRVPFWVAGLAFVGILFVQIFPSFYGIGIEPAPRVINSIYFFFLLGWFYNLAVLVSWVYRRNWQNAQSWYLPPSIKALLSVLALVSVFFSPNLRMVYGDWLRGRAAAYDVELTQRYAYIEQAKGEIVYVAPLKNRPKSLMLDDLNRDPKHWWSKCTGGYFGKKAVILTHENK
ncbi:MAG: hypothetical protein MUE30_04640 [Spirosomaceae bacterium]|nr:hypothetical protein [Spirosomataceae bacterium]